MKKNLHSLILIIALWFYSCSYPKKSDSLKAWEGEYSYEEQPIQANAGYYMVMDWKLNIHKVADKYIGDLEINGQQTLMKIQTEISGNEKTIFILFSKTLEGNVESINPSDTLFQLQKEGEGIITKWNTLEPRLSAIPIKECICFKRY